MPMQQIGAEAVISIQDNGVGIPSQMLPKIFEMFAQVESNEGRLKEGLGIGLSIVQRLVEMHGGSVVVHSDGHGMGSEFVVRLPVALSVAGEALIESSAIIHPAKSLRILVVDDNLNGAESLAMMLTMMGNETQMAHDGFEALAAAEVFRPDVIFLDILMPKMNGYELAQRIRQQNWGKEIMLVALTGLGHEEDKRLSLEATLDAHLT